MEEPLWKITACISWALISAQQPSRLHFLTPDDNILFSDYERHFANIQETLESLIRKAYDKTGDLSVCPMITGSGGLTLAKHLEVHRTGGYSCIYRTHTLCSTDRCGNRARWRGMPKSYTSRAATWNSV